MADQGSYYVPEQSKLPLGAALGMGTMGFGAAMWVIDGQSATVFFVGLAILAIVMYKWWGIVIEENMNGMVSNQLKHSYVLGMLWLGNLICWDKPIFKLGAQPFLLAELFKVIIITLTINQIQKLRKFI